MVGSQGYGAEPRRRRRAPNMFVVTLLVLFGTALGGSAVLFGPQLVDDLLNGSEQIGSTVAEPGSLAEGPAQDVLTGFVAALEAGDLGGVEFTAESVPGAAQTELATLTEGLGDHTLAAETQPVIMASASAAQGPIELTWTFPGDLVWTTSSQVVLEAVNGQWRVRWDPSILEPSLGPGDELIRRKLPGVRAPILGRNGAVLVEQTDLVTVGIQPSRVQDLAGLTAALQDLLGVDGAELAARVQGAAPDAFVEVVTLPRAEYEAVRDEVFPLPGTVFRQTSLPEPIDPDFARAVLGRSGEVTAEIIEANPGLFEPGDIVGLSGLQARYNGVLAGTPGMEIAVRRRSLASGTSTTVSGLTTTSAIRDPAEPESLFRIEPEAGQPVQTTIDPVAQRAAEAALQATDKTSALVAIEMSTGNVVAVANGPRGSSVNFAMTGQYPPGSIFKVVSGYAAVRDVLGPADTIDCPQSVTIQGRTIGNAENEVLGPITFRSAFAHSCNTAFINASRSFGPSILHDTAAQFGLGSDFQVGLDVFSGSVPVADSEVDLAAASFGQGRLLFSPFSAAVMAATAGGGTYRSPQLVTSPAPAPQVVQPLEPGPAAVLQELMRAVVTEGTGRVAQQAIGAPVSGKTGTAEFGNDVPPKSHAWFVGYQGDIAFAVFVEAGEFGGATAAPIATTFLNTLSTGG